ncbi:MAG TPA: VWA domain-containing protein [Chloroflexota bacterium]|nr:VWA domain-containing protein [Chloroflexota bacterium]
MFSIKSYSQVINGDVDCILEITADSGEEVVAAPSRKVVGLILDTSGSMEEAGERGGSRIAAVRAAAKTAVDLLDAETIFFVVAFASAGHLVIPPTPANAEAKGHAYALLDRLRASGGTAMSQGLRVALNQFKRYPQPDTVRYAVFLTDGKNQSEHESDVIAALRDCQGLFDVDCWGVGTDWKVGEVQLIARELNGKASLIPDAEGVAAAFQKAIAKVQAKQIPSVRLRLWHPQSAEIVSVEQCHPTIDDLTRRAVPVDPHTLEYAIGNWAFGETREYHLTFKTALQPNGQAAVVVWPRLVYPTPEGDRELKRPEDRVLVSDDGTLKLDPHVAHYTGQKELAEAIQVGLQKRAEGDTDAATHLLGRAAKLAEETGNEEITVWLRKVVDIVDAPTGTVRLKRNVDAANAMDLEVESTSTRRIARRPAGGS